jgi:hypothetical protein
MAGPIVRESAGGAGSAMDPRSSLACGTGALPPGLSLSALQHEHADVLQLGGGSAGVGWPRSRRP